MERHLDPELAASARHLPEPADGPIDAQASRAALRGLIEARAAAGIVPPGRDQLTIDDLRVPGHDGDPEVAIRVYRPAGPASGRAGMVQFHGGGFVAGDLDSEDERSVAYAHDAGLVVLSVDYRLAPEHAYPAALRDGYAVLSWAAANAASLGVERNRIGVGGCSAGGNLAAATALWARDLGGPLVAFQFLLFPALDDRMDAPSKAFVGTPFIDGRSTRRLWDCYLGDGAGEPSPYAAPGRCADLRSLPPAYIVTAELDPLRDDGIGYALRLMDAGVPVDLRNYAATFHAFDSVPSTISTHAKHDQLAWLRRTAGSTMSVAP
jgi:acetyl esterase